MAKPGQLAGLQARAALSLGLQIIQQPAKRSGGLCAIFWQVVRTSMISIECYFNQEYAAMARGETRIGSAEDLVLGYFLNM